jgi:plasmid stabilization system protein ParE
MNYRIHITVKAEQDITEAADYIEFHLLNPQASDDLLDAVDNEISGLSSMPQKHQLVDDPVLSLMGIRFILVHNYIAFYIIDESDRTVHIVRFLYQGRNWMKILKAEPIHFL